MAVEARNIFRIETNYGEHYVSHVSAKQVRDAMREYIVAWVAAGHSLASAKYVYLPIELSRRLPKGENIR